MGEEFFYNVEDGIDKGGAKHKHSFIENNFGGYLCNYISCLECDYKSRTFDFFIDL